MLCYTNLSLYSLHKWLYYIRYELERLFQIFQVVYPFITQIEKIFSIKINDMQVCNTCMHILSYHCHLKTKIITTGSSLCLK